MSASRQRLVRTLVLGLAIAALAWWSARPVRVWAREQAPLEITCADYLKSRPHAHWLRLTHCEPDLTEGHLVIEKAFEQGHFKAKNVYVVMRPAGNPQASNLMLQRNDPEMLELGSKDEAAPHLPKLHFDLGLGAPPQDSGPPEDPLVHTIIDELQAPQEGMITEPSGKARDEIVNLNLGIDDEFTILEHGKKPDATLGILGLLVALLATGGLVVDIMRNRKRDRAGSGLVRE